MTNITEDKDKWTNVGVPLFDECIEKGIPQGKLTMMVGKSRQTGKSMYYMSKMMSEWRKTHRQMKLKRIFDIINNNS